jgi:hypothetical protein
MSRCLREETLWLLSEGEGTSAERTHLEGCADCARRYEQLTQDLKKLGRVIQKGSFLSPTARPRRVRSFRWGYATAAIVALLVVIWGGVWLREPAQFLWSALSAETLDGEDLQFLQEEVFPAMFSTTGIGLGTLPGHATDGAYLEAAVNGGWPCAQQESSDLSGCDTDMFSFLLDGQDS